MTLVPIIYASLLIFSALLLFVLLVSYISYKAKSSIKNNALRISAESQAIKNRPAAIQMQQRPVVLQKEAAAIQQKKIQIEHSRVQERRIPTMERVEMEKTIRANEHRYYSAKNLYQNHSKPTREDRIVIMNNPQKFEPTRPAGNSNGQRASQKLPDLNLLNYYSDRTDSEFITLTA